MAGLFRFVAAAYPAQLELVVVDGAGLVGVVGAAGGVGTVVGGVGVVVPLLTVVLPVATNFVFVLSVAVKLCGPLVANLARKVEIPSENWMTTALVGESGTAVVELGSVTVAAPSELVSVTLSEKPWMGTPWALTAITCTV